MFADPLIGRKLGDYTIQSLLGRGGMSRVYRGYDENLDRYAAVKVISGDFATTSEAEYTRRFQIEARSIARLRHPSIVGVYQFGRNEGIYYMAMVFLEGKDLRVLLKEYADRGQRMPLPEILRVVRDVASALDYAHEQGVIHRDIKPSNIMLEKRSGRAILMDFGLALSVQEGTMGDTFGSAHYIAPEQAVSSAKAVSQSDLYSLGIIIYEMLAGKVPFDDPSAMSVALKHLNEVPPPPSMYNPNLPPAIEAVIMRVLDKDPEQRYPTGSALVQALEDAYRESQDQIPYHNDEVGRPVVDMLDLLPAKPAAPAPSLSWDMTASQASRGTPPPPTPPFRMDQGGEEPAKSGIAGRFARRKAKKDEEAALKSISEDALQINETDLESLLDSYVDPRDIGLVGPDARGVTLSESHDDSQPRPREENTPRKKRSPLGLFLALVLVVVVIGGAVWLGLGNSGGDDGGDENALAVSSTQTQVALAPLATDEPTAVAEPVTATTDLPTATRTEPARTATRETGPAATEQSLSETIAVAEQPSDTPEPPAATETAASTVTDTALPASETPVNTAPDATQVTEPATEQAVGEITASPIATATNTRTSGQTSNVHMVYNNNEFLLVNVSDEPIDVSDLMFVQTSPYGEEHSFDASNWRNTSRLGAGGCYQLLRSEATRVRPSSDICQVLYGWFRSNVPDRYFWISNRPGATFIVHRIDNPVPLATCKIELGECSFYLPPQ